MKKSGCGFIIVCLLGLGGLFLLNFSYQTYTKISTQEDTRYTYFTYANVEDVLREDVPADSSAVDLIPILTYEFNGEVVIDTAYDWRYMEFQIVGMTDPLGHYYPGQEFELAVNEEDKSDYIKWEERPLSAEDQLPLVVIGAVIGGLLTLIWLIGLRRAFRLKEQDQDPYHRM